MNRSQHFNCVSSQHEQVITFHFDTPQHEQVITFHFDTPQHEHVITLSCVTI